VQLQFSEGFISEFLRSVKLNRITAGEKRLYGLTEKGHTVRRFWHLSVVFALFYYLVPETMFKLGSFNFDRNYVLLTLFLIIAVMELLRLTGKWNFSLFRDYERYRVSAPFWFSATTAIIILLTPQWFAVPCILCVTFADPVLGELRVREFKYYPLIGIIMCTAAFMLYSYPIIIAVLLGSVATLAEIISNRDYDKTSLLFVSGMFDDNFLMQIIPALFISLIWLAGSHLGFQWLPPETETLLAPLY
jgi:hypothetical protein